MNRKHTIMASDTYYCTVCGEVFSDLLDVPENCSGVDQTERQSLIDALDICASGWGWWNRDDPPIVSRLPRHPTVRKVISIVRQRERNKYNTEERSDS